MNESGSIIVTDMTYYIILTRCIFDGIIIDNLLIYIVAWLAIIKLIRENLMVKL